MEIRENQEKIAAAHQLSIGVNTTSGTVKPLRLGARYGNGRFFGSNVGEGI